MSFRRTPDIRDEIGETVDSDVAMTVDGPLIMMAVPSVVIAARDDGTAEDVPRRLPDAGYLEHGEEQSEVEPVEADDEVWRIESFDEPAPWAPPHAAGRIRDGAPPEPG
jgi:hypothetical protein